jgi:hypothetical protein
MKGALFLYKMGSAWALRHFKSLKRKYIPKDAPLPQVSGEKPDHVGKKPTSYPDKNPFLDINLRFKMGLPPIPVDLTKTS